MGVTGAVRTLVGNVVLPLIASNETRLWTTLGARLAGKLRGADTPGIVRGGRPSRGLATVMLPLIPRMKVDRCIFVA